MAYIGLRKPIVFPITEGIPHLSLIFSNMMIPPLLL